MEEPLLRISSDFASGLKNKKNNRSKEMKLIKKNALFELKDFLILWSTQSVSQLGSSLTGFALTLWLYEKTGSSLSTAALTICTYAPYVLMSIFAGVLTDRLDKKKTMLGCDMFAAVCTLLVFVLYQTNRLMVWHLYVLNAVSGLMNTVQQPAGEVAMTLIMPEKYYQKTSGLRSLSNSLISTLNPLIATALYAFAGLNGVIAVDIGSFLVAFTALLFFVKIPFDAVLPGYVLPNPKGGSTVLGIVTSCSGAAMIVGSLAVSVLPKPKNRVRVIYLTMLFSLGTENFLLAFSREPLLWCIGQFIGWVVVPIMSANLDVILRTAIPVELQGRVYACRNTLQFFTIPIGLFLGGFMVDQVCEPFMRVHGDLTILKTLFGTGKGSGAALMMLILGISGSLFCLITGRKLKKY